MKLARLLAKVSVDVDLPDACWPWLGGVDRDGYGVINISRRMMKCHRISYEAFAEPIPAGLVIDHLCRNKRCVRPSHLEPVTILENTMRGVVLRTKCPNGHEYTPENTRIRAGTVARTCKICDRARVAAYKARKARSAMSEVPA